MICLNITKAKEKLSINGDGFSFLVGKSIVKVDVNKGNHESYVPHSYMLTCADGTKILVKENDGCGGCNSGWSDISEIVKLQDTDNVITAVKTVYDETDDEDRFTLFIYYHDKTCEIDGDDGYGNGYYGGGFEVYVYDVE